MITSGKFKNVYSDSFNSTVLVSNLLKKPTKSVEEFLSELDRDLTKINFLIASSVTKHRKNLASRITNLNKLHLAMRGLVVRVGVLKNEISKSKASGLQKGLSLKKYVSMAKTAQSTAKSLRFILRCLNNLETLRKCLKPFQCLKCSENDSPSFSCACDTRAKHISSREVVRAAKVLYSTEKLMHMGKLIRIDILDRHRIFLKRAGLKIREECSRSLYMAIQKLNQNDLGNSLQAFYNLNTMPVEVYNGLNFLAASVSDTLNDALDVPTKPSPDQAPVMREKLWTNLELLCEKIHVTAMQAWTLERILKQKRDPINHQNFLTFVQNSSSYIASVRKNNRLSGRSDSDNVLYRPFNVFWDILIMLLSKHFSRVAKKNTLVKRIFSQEYPRLRFALNDVLIRISRSIQTRSPAVGHEREEEISYRKSGFISTIAEFLKIFLARSHSRLHSVVPDNMPTKRDTEMFVAAAKKEEELVRRNEDLHAVIHVGIEKVASVFCMRAIRFAVLDCGRSTNVESRLSKIRDLSSSLNYVKEVFSLNKLCVGYESLLEETISLLNCTEIDIKKRMFALPNSVLLHFIVGMCPLEMEMPHVREKLSVSDYVSEWIKQDELNARKNIMKSLDLYRQRISASTKNSISVSESRCLKLLESLLGLQ